MSAGNVGIISFLLCALLEQSMPFALIQQFAVQARYSTDSGRLFSFCFDSYAVYTEQAELANVSRHIKFFGV